MRRIKIEFTAPEGVDIDDITERASRALGVSSLTVSSAPAQEMRTFEFHGTFTLSVQDFTVEDATENVTSILDDTFDDYEIERVL